MTEAQCSPSFVDILADVFWPKKKSYLVLHVAAVIVGLDYWISSLVYESGIPAGIMALYRAEGDTQYVGLVSTLARGLVGESVLYESVGTGMQAFPLGSMALHTLMAALFGPPGHAVADGLSALGYFLGMTLLLRTLGFGGFFARLVALSTTNGFMMEALKWLVENRLMPPMQFRIWGLRLPRPLVTEIPLFLSWSFAIALLTFPQDRSRRVVWVGLGLSLAWLVQGDVHGAASAGLFAAVAAFVAAFRLGALGSALRRVGLCALSFGVAMVPFLLQQMKMHPDVTRRWGAFSVSRFPPPQTLEADLPLFYQVLAALALSLALRQLYLLQREVRVPERARWYCGLLPYACIFGICFATWISMPAFHMLTGKGIQLYHFEDRWLRTMSYAIIFALTSGAEALGLGLLATLRFLWRPSARLVLPAAVLLMAGGSSWRVLDDNHVVRRGNPRVDFPGNGAYKSDLIELAGHLSRPEYDKAPVLGTYDHSVNLWWVSFRNGFSFVPDPFHTARPDAELEKRFVAFAHELKMPKGKFAQIARTVQHHVYWLSGAKYNAQPLYAIAPLSDYSEADRKAIENAGIFAGWNIRIPNSAVEHLVDLYAQPYKQEFRPPDLIVMNLHDRINRFSPPRDTYEKVFENSTFRAWKRKAMEKK